jgi:hypothetical protein
MAVKRHPWLERVVNPLVISTMMGCIATALVELITLFSPGWSGTYLTVGCVLAALEATYSHRLSQTRKLRGGDLTRFRLAEIATILVLLKVGSYVGRSWVDILAEIRVWPRDLLALLNAETVASSLVVLWCWLMATLTMQDLERIGDPLDSFRDRVPASHAVLDRIFGGGLTLLIITGITRIGLEELLNFERPSVPGLILNVLVYFLLGFVLIGQAEFLTLDRQWSARQIKISPTLPRRWTRYSLVLLVLVAVIAFMLPTGYTMGLLDVAGSVLTAIAYVARLAWELVAFLVLLVAWLLTLLFSSQGEPPPPPDLGSVEPPAVTTGADVAGTPGWIEILRSFLFWAVVLGAIFYVLRTYLRDHPEIVRALLTFRPIRFVRDILLALWRRLTRAAKTIGERLPRSLPLLRRPGKQRQRGLLRFFRLSALSPRERTLYYYLSILRRAGRAGFPRGPSQTPYEYDDSLQPHLEQAQQEMDLLTGDFVEARYSHHPIDQEREGQVRTRWKRVRAAVRALRIAREPEQNGKRE